MKQKLIKILSWPFITISNAIDSQNTSFFADRLVPLKLLIQILAISLVVGFFIPGVGVVCLAICSLAICGRYWRPTFATLPTILAIFYPANLILLARILVLPASSYSDSSVPVLSAFGILFILFVGTRIAFWIFEYEFEDKAATRVLIWKILASFGTILLGFLLFALFMLLSSAIDSIFVGKEAFYTIEHYLSEIENTFLDKMSWDIRPKDYMGISVIATWLFGLALTIFPLLLAFYQSIYRELLFKEIFLRINAKTKSYRWLSFVIAALICPFIITLFAYLHNKRLPFDNLLPGLLIPIFIVEVAITIQYFFTKNIWYVALLAFPFLNTALYVEVFSAQVYSITSDLRDHNTDGSVNTEVPFDSVGVAFVDKYISHEVTYSNYRIPGRSLIENIKLSIILQLPKVLKSILFCLLIAGIYKLINRYKNKKLMEVKI